MGAAIIQIILVLRPDAAGLLFMYMVALALIWTGISTFLTWRKKENLDE